MFVQGKAPNNKLTRMDSFRSLLLDYNNKRRLQNSNSGTSNSSDDLLITEGLKVLNPKDEGKP